MRPTKKQREKIESMNKAPDRGRYFDAVPIAVPRKVDPSGGAEQHHREETHLPSVLERYSSTGEAPILNPKTPLYGDFSTPTDLHTQMNRVAEAQQAFQALPSRIRSAAANDPVRFLEMVNDPAQLQLLQEEGLVLNDEAPGSAPPPEPNPPSSPQSQEAAPDGAADPETNPDG